MTVISVSMDIVHGNVEFNLTQCLFEQQADLLIQLFAADTSRAMIGSTIL